jgi:hypothetical protein
MPILDANKTRKSLLKKGFVQLEGDHHWFLYYYQGKVVAKTKVSHNDQDIYDKLIGKMYKQCQMINKNQFIDLVNCPLDEAQYVEILKGQGII